MSEGTKASGMYTEFSLERIAKENFPDYTNHKCMVKKHLTPEMYEAMYKRVTPCGVTIDKCIQGSVCNMGDIMGLLAGDEYCYKEFHEIFDAVINDKHGGFSSTDQHPPPCLDASLLLNGKLDNKYVKSCRIRTGRGIRGYCFPPSMNRVERRRVEKAIIEALAGLTGDLSGKYFPLTGMNPDDEQRLINDHFLFQKPDGHLMVNSGSVRDWPDARGIWHNDDKTFLIWVNEEDHCRVIAMELGGDMEKTFERFCRGLNEVARLMKATGNEFMHSDRLGYLCACPSNIGTGLRCSVHVQLHNLQKHAKFEQIVTGFGLQKRGTGGEHTAAVDSVYDLSNQARLKKSELQFVQQVVDAVLKIIEMEKRLEDGKSIDDLLPEGAK